jgi:hypothetical protein
MDMPARGPDVKTLGVAFAATPAMAMTAASAIFSICTVILGCEEMPKIRERNGGHANFRRTSCLERPGGLHARRFTRWYRRPESAAKTNLTNE